jgi:prephenate dehydrogenase
LGVGLIGGSLARALRVADACREIVGCGRNADNLRRACELGVIDRYEQDPAVAVAGADLVVLAVPLGVMRETLERIRGALAEGVVITDAGSAKQCVIDDARAVFGEVPPSFVPGHPIAGTERSGVEASFAELFQGRKVILTPLAETDFAATARVTAVWQAAGAEVVEMGAGHHDQVLAATSHLPHLLAYSLVDTLARLDDRAEIFRFAAGGFRDFSRIASSDPGMWRDICLANRRPLLDMLAEFDRDLSKLREALQQADGERLMTVFRHAKNARDNLYRE